MGIRNPESGIFVVPRPQKKEEEPKNPLSSLISPFLWDEMGDLGPKMGFLTSFCPINFSVTLLRV